MLFVLSILLSLGSLIWSFYLMYFWLVTSGQSPGAAFPLGVGWLFSAQLQLLSLAFAAMNYTRRVALLLAGLSLLVFILTTGYFILFM
ncbi:MAG: hypothetical protein ACT6SF_12075 [Hydrogenophaga sp.]|jgi:hypothetical protein|uniref:hypothetical protein n=1 Tax=Hydrogenophaga sp. TaxID=1904254 RepID=UPI001D67DEEA|nr:hypothetical protein [Hydrogenophaga sp.]MBW0171537.1 hypothetical protein [Hydrogenophaga sp.]MBW0182872.1 hypothetical protein [Hydrogenophaga sp.]